jgi:hypothetical protein
MSSVMIEFDGEREPTIREAILLKRIATHMDFEALLDLIELRSTKPVLRSDLESLTLSQARDIGNQLGAALGAAMVLSGIERQITLQQ